MQPFRAHLLCSADEQQLVAVGRGCCRCDVKVNGRASGHQLADDQRIQRHAGSGARVLHSTGAAAAVAACSGRLRQCRHAGMQPARLSLHPHLRIWHPQCVRAHIRHPQHRGGSVSSRHAIPAGPGAAQDGVRAVTTHEVNSRRCIKPSSTHRRPVSSPASATTPAQAAMAPPTLRHELYLLLCMPVTTMERLRGGDRCWWRVSSATAADCSVCGLRSSVCSDGCQLQSSDDNDQCSADPLVHTSRRRASLTQPARLHRRRP